MGHSQQIKRKNKKIQDAYVFKL